eukprot:7391454-Prymnesium_polylepis.2
MHRLPPNAALTCGLSARSCALGQAQAPRKSSTKRNKPAVPAADSACPAFAFTLPAANGVCVVRSLSSAPRVDPASIGSPNGVPVPCASMQLASVVPTPASPSAANISACCAGPLGAVRLALRPSWRTALPTSVAILPPPGWRAAVPHPSPRAKPSARESKVWLRPRADVIPAIPIDSLSHGVSIRLTPITSDTPHSPCCSARSPLWHATSAAEHAVSTDAFGPCRPSTNGSRPDAMDTLAPVAAYTLGPAGDARSTSSKSFE